MTRKKPTAVLVFGILNLVLGSISLVGNLCCGAGFALGYVAMRSIYQQAPPEAQKELDDLWAAFSNNVPGLLGVMIGQVVVAVVMGVIQVMSGIGMVRVRSWGRWLCAIWGLLEVVFVIASLFYQMTYLYPGMQKATQDFEKWMEKQEEKQRKMGQTPPPRQKFNMMGGSSGNVIADNALSIIFSGLYLGYGALVFIVMVLPNTGKAIARYNGTDGEFPGQGQDDFYDDDYQRRRRDLDQPPPDVGPPPP